MAFTASSIDVLY